MRDWIFIGPKTDHCLALSVGKSLLVLNFAQIVGFVKVKVKFDTWISLRLYGICVKVAYMDLLKLFHGFVKVVYMDL